MDENERAAVGIIRRSMSEWVDAKREADRVRALFVASGHINGRGVWMHPPRILDECGMEELRAADTLANEKWECHQRALREWRILLGDEAA